MSTQRVHFSSPLETTQQHMASAGKSSAEVQCKASLAEWWGDFVPIDQWEPPRVRSRFQHLQFRRYDMSPETRIETLDSRIGDSTPDEYERSFAGVEVSIQELAAMFDKSWGMSEPSTPERSADLDKEVNRLVDDSPSYDLGWNVPSAASSSNPSPSVDDNTRDDGDEEGPGYDLRWGLNVTSGQLPEVVMDEDDAPAYDLGWGSTHLGEQPVQQDAIDGHGYDLGWGPAPAGEHQKEEEDDNDEPSYDLGWGSTPASEHPMQQEVVDLTGEDEPLYDLGWGEHQGSGRKTNHSNNTQR
ncbi:uncharacterized protein EDB91DRAFT_1249379 [Suillus paluster]|uniref:uncharacterized protein n=1 Tax=Suillus paluster TaxID=48578 RepID=UPI001B87F792|nr:uncharacterized protein EDB91DRAFT_1249379 [Suillus paluster]KAG1738083.1 hypothetical protein EDB91DRAFT_1249379 [Suillus paluster]